MRILLIEDDEKIAEFVRKGLIEQGYGVDWSADGEDGLHLALNANYDACILDLMLPLMDGLSVLRAIRAQGLTSPVIILSAKHSVDDRVECLKLGADDYLVKPFSFTELTARLEAIIRRVNPACDPQRLLCVGDLKLDRFTRVAVRAGREIELKPKEFALLSYLMQHAGRVVGKTELLEMVWGYDFDPGTNTIDVLMFRLRSKVEQAGESKILHTVRGAGYVVGP